MDDILKNEIDYLLKERVWKTKKSRMEAEARLIQNNLIADILVNYYTFAVIVYSILALVLDSGNSYSKNITISTLVLSIGLFGITLFLSSVGFKQKATQFKDSYHKLDLLEIDINHLLRSAQFKSKKQIIDELYVLEQKYIYILSLTDNHHTIDHDRIVIMRKLKGLSQYLKNKFYAKKILKWLLIVFLFIFPFLLALIVELF
ncbi:SLATT domain-containing protein [Paenibacillus albiflavus]|uniref:SLATT domain-containing protein n=1 Tax=Paenibacillus albiflavus TaxID=2545760 RepID=A0A4R4E5X5_9BACL|nr:SLATT domain-containing protein [Paenibacillus albiflavus]TCZ75064.1 SLATT domain-containing protein [Paenibacillus albiflavus]